MVAWADQLRVEKGENLLGKSETNWNLWAGSVTPTETVTEVPTEAGRVKATSVPPESFEISTWVEARCNIGAAFWTAVVTLAVLAPLKVAARAPTLTA